MGGMFGLVSFCVAMVSIQSFSSWIFSVSYSGLQNFSREFWSGGFLTSIFSFMRSLYTLLGLVANCLFTTFEFSFFSLFLIVAASPFISAWCSAILAFTWLSLSLYFLKILLILMAVCLVWGPLSVSNESSFLSVSIFFCIFFFQGGGLFSPRFVFFRFSSYQGAICL